jgi:spermidine dehydrogenase
MEDVVLARLRYDRLDEPDRPVRIRLSSTVVQARNRRGGVDIGYVRQGRLRRVRARHVVMAGWNMMIPHVVPETPEPQRAALRNNVKMPLVYAKVAIADWRAAARLKVHDIYAPGAFFARTKLDFPVSMGGYRCPRDPSEPMVLHMVHVPTTAEGFSDARDALRAGRGRLLGMPFAAFEGEIRGQLDRMLGPGGFESGRDIRAITVNRWSHGYSGSPATLGGDPDDGDAEIAAAAKPIGRIAVANADRAWSAYLHSAIDAAHAAVGELPA